MRRRAVTPLFTAGLSLLLAPRAQASCDSGLDLEVLVACLNTQLGQLEGLVEENEADLDAHQDDIASLQTEGAARGEALDDLALEVQGNTDALASVDAFLDIIDDIAWVGGGYMNHAGDPDDPSDGTADATDGRYAAVSGGIYALASGRYASVTGGWANTAGGQNGWAGGGFTNQALGDGAAILGGSENLASSSDATIAGGKWNTASAYCASVSGEQGYDANSEYELLP